MPEFKLTIKGEFFELPDTKGNLLYGFFTGKSRRRYEIVGARFEGSAFTKTRLGWKRDHRGQVSKAFYDWEAPARDALYRQFYNLDENGVAK